MYKIYNKMKYFAYGLQFFLLCLHRLVVCILLGIYLMEKFDFGTWVIIVAIIFCNFTYDFRFVQIWKDFVKK